MTTALVTGAAGFVGSHLCEHLLGHGDRVVGVDCFSDYYGRDRKERNLAAVVGRPAFDFIEADLAVADLKPLVEHAAVVYHLAAQPGVRASWGREFPTYVRQNIIVTQRLLEACAGRPLQKFVYASSSSVYGDAETLPTPETVRPAPVSPYGVTKLAAEHLCEAYRSNVGVPAASLRLFTVYGPRQRPDMAFSRLVDAALTGAPFELYGDGTQTRDFTFVGDVVRAMRDAAASDWCGVANIGGGSRISMAEVISAVELQCGPLTVVSAGSQRGDARHTAADIGLAARAYGYRPRTTLADGLAAMVAAASSAATPGATGGRGRAET